MEAWQEGLLRWEAVMTRWESSQPPLAASIPLATNLENGVLGGSRHLDEGIVCDSPVAHPKSIPAKKIARMVSAVFDIGPGHLLRVSKVAPEWAL